MMLCSLWHERIQKCCPDSLEESSRRFLTSTELYVEGLGEVTTVRLNVTDLDESAPYPADGSTVRENRLEKSVRAVGCYGGQERVQCCSFYH